MTSRLHLDLLVAYESVGRAIAEITFCAMHPELTGATRRTAALRAFAEANVRVEELKRKDT